MIKDYVILKNLKVKYKNYKLNLDETVAYEEIQKDKVYKVEGSDIRIEFEPVKVDEVWRVFFSKEDGKDEFCVVYKINPGLYVARATDSPNIEKEGNSMVNASLDLLVTLGEI